MKGISTPPVRVDDVYIERNASNLLTVKDGNKRLATKWICFTGTGPSIAIRDSYGVTSITDNAIGDYTITWNSAFSNTDYLVCTSCESYSSAIPIIANIKLGGYATNSINLRLIDESGNLRDSATVNVLAIGV